GPSLGSHADDAVSQAALQRAQRLPFQAIDRIAGRMALRNGGAGELLLGIVIMAVGAAEIELTLAPPVDVCTFGTQRCKLHAGRRRNRLAGWLEGDISRPG